MIWIEILEKFGISKLNDEIVCEQDLNYLEDKLCCKFPLDYRLFLQKFGESDLESFVVFQTAGGGVYPGSFFGVREILENSFYTERLPKNCIPINDDGASNLIVLSLEQSRFGEIFFQHHSIGLGSSADSNKNRWKTLSYLAKDFSSFIQGFVPDE